MRDRAARNWCAWEDAVLSLDPGATPRSYGDRADDAMLAFVRICSHYFANGAWLEEGAVLRDATSLGGIPGVLIHGRLDLSCPLDTAWELSCTWPTARLVVLDRSGHGGTDEQRTHLLAALDGFAATES